MFHGSSLPRASPPIHQHNMVLPLFGEDELPVVALGGARRDSDHPQDPLHRSSSAELVEAAKR